MRDARLPGFPLVVPIEVQFRDLDAVGHVNNSVYMAYLEIARTKYWVAIDQPMDFSGIGYVIARVEIDFVSSAEFLEQLLVGIRLSEMGTKSFAYDYEIVAEGPGPSPETRLIARARSIQVFYDWGEKRSLPIPDSLRARVEQFEGRPVSRGA